MKLRAATVIARDLACTLLGLVGIVHQEFWGVVSVPLLVVYVTMLGVPGAANLLALRFGTASSSSPPQPPSSPAGSD